MPKFRYFELHEFLDSKIAQERCIDNTPTFEIVDHLSMLTEQLLDPLRAAYGAPIHVNSGYRCEQLNRAVGGVENSAHLDGWAADLRPTRGSLTDFIALVRAWLLTTHRKFDQCIIEKSAGTTWLHLALYDRNGQQRGRIFHINL